MKIKYQNARELLGKRDYLMKVNKPSMCHNPQKAWTTIRAIFSLLVGLIQRSYIKYFQLIFEISCPSRTPPCNHGLAIAPHFRCIFLHVAFVLFCRLLLTTGLKRVRLKRDCNTIAMYRHTKLKFAFCEH